jgi:hypothetical protein
MLRSAQRTERARLGTATTERLLSFGQHLAPESILTDAGRVPTRRPDARRYFPSSNRASTVC